MSGRITTKSGDRDIAEVIGEEHAAAMAAVAVQLRPSGGKVLMDAAKELGIYHPAHDGYVYIGTASAETEKRSTSRARPRGTPSASGQGLAGWPDRSRRYVLQAGDIRDPERQQPLSSVVGGAEAARLARNLLAQKGKTGRIYVAPDGQVATRIGDQHVIIGSVDGVAWFRG